MNLDDKLIETIWDRFEKSSAVKMEIELDGSKFVLEKETKQQPVMAPTFGIGAAGYAASANMQAVNAPAAVMPAAATPTATSATEATVQNEDYIRAPLPGTFYRAASPEDEPYVSVGQRIEKGEVVAIVESMKMMNEIVADKTGVVVEILAENGSMVGYDEALFRLEAADV